MRNSKAIIEFGTSKISCTVAQRRSRMGLEVLGSTQVAYSGIKHSNWVDSDEVFYVLEQVLESVENQVGTRIRAVEVGIPGSFLKIMSRTAEVPIRGRVTEKDIEKLANKARRFQTAEDLTLVCEWPAWFYLDDKNVYLDPVGVPTQRMQGCMSFTFANRYFLNDIIELFKHLGVRVDNFIPEPMATALYLVPQEKRDSLAVLVDIGYHSTNVSLLYGDAILYFDTIEMGGGSITSDLCYVMKIDQETAEQLKRRYSFGLEENNNLTYMYAKDSEGKLKKYPYDLVKEIIDARAEHLILYVQKIFAKAEQSLNKKFDVFLTGGGISFMRGDSSFYRAVSGRTPIPIKVNNAQLETPDMHAAYAMLQFAYDEVFVIRPQPQRKSFFERLGLFK